MGNADDNTPEQPMTLRGTVESSAKSKASGMPGPARDGGGDKQDKPKTSLSETFSWPGRIALLLAIVLSPWAFGAWEFWAQLGITSLLLVGLAFWWFETAMNERRSQIFPFLFVPIFIGLLIALFQLVSLPDSIANLLLVRQLDLYDTLATTSNVPKSISVNHEGTWHQIRLLIIALSGLLLGCRYFRSRNNMVLLMSVVTLNGVALSLFGIIQKLSWNGQIYWFRKVTLGGSPFGPFVNRNNASGYLLICLACAVGLLPIVLSKRKTKGPVNLISTEMPFWRQAYQHLLEFIAELTASKMAVLVSLATIAIAIFAALSRGGVGALLVAAIATILAYGMARKPKNSSFIFIPIIVLTAAVGGWIGFGDELSQRFERIDTVNFSESDLRMRHWQDTYSAVGDYGVLGSGLGTYKEVHRLYRQDHENVIFHFAENQFFQALVEAGWPGLIVFLIAWWLAFHCASLALREGSSPTTIGIGAMGIFLIFSQAVASVFDFGFYIPANLLALSVVFGLLAYHSQALAVRLKDKPWLSIQTPNYIVQGIVLALFAAACFVGIDYFGRMRVQQELYPRSVFFSPETMDLEKTDAKLASLLPLIEGKPTTAGLNYAAMLQLHRGRLQMLQAMEAEPGFQETVSVMAPEQQKIYRSNLWNLTDLQHIHDHVAGLKRESKYAASRFLNQPSIMENLPLAARLLNVSRRKSILQPRIHLKLGQIQGVLEYRNSLREIPHEGDVNFERAIQAAPANVNFRFLAAVYYLQSGRPELAAPHIKRSLQLKPSDFNKALELVTGRTNRSFPPVDPVLIAEQMLPNDPSMLFELAQNYFLADSEQQKKQLERIAGIIEKAEIRKHKNVVLLGDVRMLQGDRNAALDQYSAALRTDPSDRPTRFKRAQLLVEFGDLEEALDDANHLKENGPKVTKYDNFLNEVKRLIAVGDKEKRSNQTP